MQFRVSVDEAKGECPRLQIPHLRGKLKQMQKPGLNTFRSAVANLRDPNLKASHSGPATKAATRNTSQSKPKGTGIASFH